MIKFKGRCSFKQYLPKKTIKRGYKVWSRADSQGCLCEFRVDTGKNKEKGLGLGESVIEKASRALNEKLY